MSATPEPTVNEAYRPTGRADAMLDLLKDGRETGEPWGYITPAIAADTLDMHRQNTSRELRNLLAAGWIEEVSRGVYRFVDDPREERH